MLQSNLPHQPNSLTGWTPVTFSPLPGGAPPRMPDADELNSLYCEVMDAVTEEWDGRLNMRYTLALIEKHPLFAEVLLSFVDLAAFYLQDAAHKEELLSADHTAC